MRWRRTATAGTTAVVLALGLLEGGLPTAGSAEAVRVGGAGAALRTMVVLAEAYRATGPTIPIQVVPGLGSQGGREALLAGAIDLAVTAQPPAPGDETRGIVHRQIGRTPVVFATFVQGTVDGLSTEQLVDMYRGRMIAWPDGHRLRLILRPPGHAETAALRALSPAMAAAVADALARPGMLVAGTAQEAADAIEAIPGAVGTSTLALIRSEGRPLKALSLDGIAPTPETLAEGRYPLAATLYLLTRRDRPRAVQRFQSFLDTPRARAALARLGFLPP